MQVPAEQKVREGSRTGPAQVNSGGEGGGGGGGGGAGFGLEGEEAAGSMSEQQAEHTLQGQLRVRVKHSCCFVLSNIILTKTDKAPYLGTLYSKTSNYLYGRSL